MGPVQPVCIYLDMNIWVDLARGLKARSGPWHEVASRLADLRADERVVLPLSGAHYRELWHRGSAASREQVGAVMRDLSGYRTLGAIDVVRRLEMDTYIERWFHGTTRATTSAEVLGIGVNHAFNSKYGRLRFVESIATSESPEGAPTSPPPDWHDSVAAGPAWEWFSLVGGDEFLKRDGLDRAPAHRDGDYWMERELRFREDLRAVPAMRRRLWDLIVVQEIQTITDELNEACLDAGVNPYGLFFAPPATDPSSAMKALVAGIPTVHVFATLRQLKHRDANHPWEQHDLSDLIALATAVPYCDAVVTEKRWAHLLTASGLSETYQTRAGSGLAGMRAVLSLAEDA
ncbi:hypothetical protein J1G43_01495 [Cellulomonas sp. zg-ZUI22]|uniref:hypothetical protein n=1 Tax=Cellulomonas sp. zg-ZUI22 TaxID=2816955 RepID=UPI001A94EAFF|nr:hypothetical protein [Cellulomonas sp. zg-ZUI22]MBO0898638.1 hypothetical protein [Cellulomonas sp. zg-ZUI22]